MKRIHSHPGVPLADLYLNCAQTQDIKEALPKSYDVHDYINV